MINAAMKYFDVSCHWCKKALRQRQDTHKRQLQKYGHHCCKNCFGKEPTFKAARTRVMTESNPFAGKTHSEETKKRLSVLRTGAPAWNKGLTEKDSTSVRKCSDAMRAFRKTADYFGANNPNWKGGISPIPQKFSEETKEWLRFRQEMIVRDCYTCCKCNEQKNGKDLDVHHMASQTRHPELKFDELNCMVLCTPCHRSFHKEFGNRSFTVGDTVRWINRDRKPDEYFMIC